MRSEFKMFFFHSCYKTLRFVVHFNMCLTLNIRRPIIAQCEGKAGHFEKKNYNKYLNTI